jgi:hypothetical protein
MKKTRKSRKPRPFSPWKSTTKIERVVYPASPNFQAGSVFTLYGVGTP